MCECGYSVPACSVCCKLYNSRKLEKNLAGSYITGVRGLLEGVSPVGLRRLRWQRAFKGT